jgi:protochlorophyllide reductase
MIANCFNPGLIVTTGLFRDQNRIFTKLFDIVATDLAKVAESRSWGGGALAYVSSVDTKGAYYTSPPGSVKYGDAAYGQQFRPQTVSIEAQDDAKAEALWELSEKALGIAI